MGPDLRGATCQLVAGCLRRSIWWVDGLWFWAGWLDGDGPVALGAVDDTAFVAAGQWCGAEAGTCARDSARAP
jgi:hypothetical protein